MSTVVTLLVVGAAIAFGFALLRRSFLNTVRRSRTPDQAKLDRANERLANEIRQYEEVLRQQHEEGLRQQSAAMRSSDLPVIDAPPQPVIPPLPVSKPPPVPMSPPPEPTRHAPLRDDFELSVRRGPRAKPPGEPQLIKEVAPGPARTRVVSTGFADVTTPGGHRDQEVPLEPGGEYLHWLQIWPMPIEGAIDRVPTTLPDQVPQDAELTVALFSPKGGFMLSGGHTLGKLKLQPDGSALVTAQACERSGVPDDVLKKRLLFDVRAPKKPGVYRLRSGIYCQGVLVQSRIIEAYVGKQPQAGTLALISDVDYTLSDTLSPTALNELAPHNLSIMLNDDGKGSHQFYFYAGAGTKPIDRPATIASDTLDGLIAQSRAALKMVSWQKGKVRGGEWDNTKTNRYEKPASLEQLRGDLQLLAARGWDIYDAIVDNLAGKSDVTTLEDALKSPGLLQIAGRQDIRFVLPASAIYDYPFDSQKADDLYQLCPVFVEAFKNKTDLLTTACFKGACPSRGKQTVICPSGFWGFRHAVGLPLSLSQDDQNGPRATETTSRLRYQGAPVMVLAVSTAPDLTERKAHAERVRTLQAQWSKQDWYLGDTRDLALQYLASDKPHLVYFYCHGGITEREGKKQPYLSVGGPNEDLIIRSTLRAYAVRWKEPQPLVFINGCHTTALDANTALDFVTGFVQAQACGVIGTEITVFEQLACDFATKFWSLFLQGQEIGRAIQRTRLDLLQAGNPLGLVYTPFVLAGMKLEKIV